MDAGKQLTQTVKGINPAYQVTGIREDGDLIRFSLYDGASFRGCEVHVDDVTNDSAVRIALGLEPLTAESDESGLPAGVVEALEAQVIEKLGEIAQPIFDQMEDEIMNGTDNGEESIIPLHPQEFIGEARGKPVFKDGGVVQLSAPSDDERARMSSMDLTARTKGELKAMAADLAIELPSNATKAEIIEILETESAVVETPEAQAKGILDDYVVHVDNSKILKFEEPLDGPVTKERKAAIRAERYPKGSKAFSDPDDSDGQT